MASPDYWDEWTPWLTARLAELQAGFVFLTRLPLPRAVTSYGATTGGAAAPPTLAQAAWTFPLAGIVVGAIGAIVYALLHRIGLTPWPAAALALAATLAATGCLHEDGLADTADGFGGGNTTDRKLAIMRDSRIGTYGVCALVLALLVRAGVVASLTQSWRVTAALIAAHAAARAVLPAMMFFVPTARSDGLSHAAGTPPAIGVIVAAALGFVVLVVTLGPGLAIVGTIALAIAVALVAWLSLHQIGGQTGDTIGAAEQVGEIVILLVALL
jgi:adenosylcobinamide-GDP ribazoletransferase